ncbi:MAG: DUF1801 domain-containing protein [Silicimonas sp.]|nr:DUF1801 domain-containing protein [Silicimonas sp.]NNL35962.1 DUF1801 domain-containing protein [Silicimonas sp.]
MTRCPPEVEAVFDTYPEAARTCLMAARAVIFEAAETAGVGPLRETLKWGQPAYLPEAPRTGTTVRMGLDGGAPAVLFHCQTTLVDQFRSDFPEAFRFSGNRALVLDEEFDRSALAICVGRALTYHRDKRRQRA